MDTRLTSASRAIASFGRVIEKLRDVGQQLNVKSRSDIGKFRSQFEKQRIALEDITISLLYGFYKPSELTTEIIEKPDHEFWSDASLHHGVHSRLGQRADLFWSKVSLVLKILREFEQEADSLSLNRDFIGTKNPRFQVLLANMEHNTQQMDDILTQTQNDWISERSKSEELIKYLMELICRGVRPDEFDDLDRICITIQDDDSNLSKSTLGDSLPYQQSFHACKNEKDANNCRAGSLVSYENLEIMKMRWIVTHCPPPQHFQHLGCIWEGCPYLELFVNIREFISHAISCEYSTRPRYVCLDHLRRSWYDNRRLAWPRAIDLSWPATLETISKGEDLRLFQNVHWKATTNNAIVKQVTYAGVVFARKTMKWSTSSHLRAVKREAAVLQTLSHFHILQFFGGYIQDQEYAMLLYPFCEQTLGEFMSNCEVSFDSTSSDDDRDLCRLYLESFFPCLAQALKFIHINFVRHMDLKPGNILIKKRPYLASQGRLYHIYIGDFGASTTLTSEAQSQTNRSIGMTAKYRAPEVGSDSAAYDFARTRINPPTWGRKADIFSLGCVYSEMLTVLAYKQVRYFDDFRAGIRNLAGEEILQESEFEEMNRSDVGAGDSLGSYFATIVESKSPLESDSDRELFPELEVEDESFHTNLPRVGLWLDNIQKFRNETRQADEVMKLYWYLRGEHGAFASWNDTFSETLDMTRSMLQKLQEHRPRAAELVRRLNVVECCNGEKIPLCSASSPP